MTTQITVTLSPAEFKALGAVAVDPIGWVQHAAYERCRLAIEEIVNSEVQRKLAIGEPITGSKEDIVLAANIESAAERHARLLAEAEAEAAARLVAEQAAQQG